MGSDHQFFNSEPLTKKTVDLTCLNQSVKRLKNISRYKMSRFVTRGFVINVHKDPEDLNHVKSILTKYLTLQNMDFLKSKTGSSVKHSGYIFFDQHTNIEIAVNKHRQSIKKKEKKQQVKFQIARKYLRDSLTPKQIAKDLKISIGLVKNTIWGIRYNKSSISDTLKNQKVPSGYSSLQTLQKDYQNVQASLFLQKALVGAVQNVQILQPWAWEYKP